MADGLRLTANGWRAPEEQTAFSSQHSGEGRFTADSSWLMAYGLRARRRGGLVAGLSLTMTASASEVAGVSSSWW